jgi:hypothetical protein
MNKKKFNCDLNGGIMVTSALRYALGRHTVVQQSIQQWIIDNWGDLDYNAKFVIIRDLLDFLYKDYLSRNHAQFVDFMEDHNNKTWKIFAVDRLSNASPYMHIAIKEEMARSANKAKWYKDIILNDLKRLESLQELTRLDQELGLQ